LDLNKLVDALRDDTVLVSIMHVNNEIGVIQDIDAIGKLVKEKGILFHVDAAQSAGKIPIDLKNAPIDLMSFSGHKVYGPKGIGALFVRQKPRIHLEPLMHGGEQEYSFRSGTLATHQIAGMGEAFKIAKNEMAIEQERILHLRECFIQGISSLDDIYINGNLEKRIAGNVNVSFANVKGEIILSGLKDLAASSGSACKSISGEPSYVLRALGVPIGLAFNSIRFSFGRFTTHEDIDFAVAHICRKL
jgi:cysteine desulfurase